MYNSAFLLSLKIESICKQTRESEIHESTKMALCAMLTFVIFGTILVVFEAVNWLLDILDITIMHPVFLSTVVIIFEELPLAGLRWNLKTSANNQMADGWGISSGICSMTAPLLGAIIKSRKMSGCCKSDDETFCDQMCSGKCGKCGVYFFILLAVGVGVINGLNWVDFEAPGAELCV